MKKLYSEQSGRSMVEMLGVLAIIGVLSVAGIAGYSKAMAKYKVSKTLDQVSMLVANLRTIYAGQANYAGLKTSVAINLGAVPTDMLGTSGKITNAFNGEVEISTPSVNGVANGGFAISYKNLSQEACVQIATSDWGSGSNSGLLGMTVSKTDATAATAAPAISQTVGTASNASTGGAANLPFTPVQASEVCANGSTIIWYYF